ncbi:MAG TPA: polyamine aminopropyltransferase [Burkholderiales bacterium]|nr:polyamine aminopropyltransferase [Burkholderiales bacterium]
MDGLHVVANLYRCRGDARYLTDAAALRQFCHDSINRAGLTILGDLFHEFDGGGVTGTVVLAESHLAIHTWPELQSVTLDVYVCNYTQDNGAKARQVVTDLMDLYRPEEHVQHDVPRDKRFMYEWLNGDYGFFLRSSKLIEASKTRFQDLEIHETPQFGKLFRLDGCFMTSEREEFVYHETLIHPALAALSAPKRVLVIGGGDGGAAEEALKHPSVDQVIMVELDEKVVEISKEHFGAIHRGVFANPKLKLLIDDGLKYLSETKEKFDHIALDLPDPIGPATALYEEAFFRDCKRALAPGGVLTLHMGSPWSRPDRVRTLYGRLAKMFKIARPYTMFIPLYGCLWSMCACSDSTDVVSVGAAEIDARVSARGVTHLQYYNGATHQALFALPNFVRELTVEAVPKPRLVAAKKRVAVGAK